MSLVPFNRRRKNYLSNPFDEFYNMVDSFFNNNDWFNVPAFSRNDFKIDVQEKDDEYLVTAELPGVEKEQVDLDLRDGRLTISVKREDRLEEENKNYIHRESYYRSMSRSIYLPDVKEDGAKAKLENGLLKIYLPREGSKNSRKIDIE